MTISYHFFILLNEGKNLTGDMGMQMLFLG